MWYKKLVIILFFYFLVLFQNSFLNHFSIEGVVPNFVLILLCLLVFFENPHKYFGIIPAVFAGFFLDIFSKSFFGVSVLTMVVIYFLIKELIHILRDTGQKHSFFYFIPIFILSLIFYDFFLILFSYLIDRSVLFSFSGYVLVVKGVYNLLFAIIGFFLFKKFRS